MAASKTRSIIAFLPPWYPTESPHALRRATQARWVASARTSGGSIRAFAWMPPPWAATTLRAARTLHSGRSAMSHTTAGKQPDLRQHAALPLQRDRKLGGARSDPQKRVTGGRSRRIVASAR